MQETISGIRVIKAFATEKKEIKDFKRKNLNLKKIVVKSVGYNAKSVAVSEALNYIMVAILLLFGGYRIYHEPYSLRYSKLLPRFMWKGIAGVLNAIPVEFPGKSYANRASKKLEERFIGNANLFSDKEKRKILKNTEGMKKPEELTAPFYEDTKGLDDVTRMQYIDINFWMIGDILLKADRMSMANSLELRVPFLDKEVWNLARTIPSKYKVTKDGQTKVAMRKAYARKSCIKKETWIPSSNKRMVKTRKILQYC